MYKARQLLLSHLNMKRGYGVSVVSVFPDVQDTSNFPFRLWSPKHASL